MQRTQYRMRRTTCLLSGLLLISLAGCLPDKFISTRLTEISIVIADSLLSALVGPILDSLP